MIHSRSVQYSVKIVPHDPTPGITHEKWHDKYHYQIMDMFLILCSDFPEKIEDNRFFNEFSKMIYNSSSKYITPF